MKLQKKWAGTSNNQARSIDDWFKLQKEQASSVIAHWGNDDKTELQFYSWRWALKVMDAVYLAEVLRVIKPKKILEIGAFIGFSTRWLLDQAPDAHVTSVDPNLNDRWFRSPQTHVKKFNAQHKHRLKIIEGFLCKLYDGISFPVHQPVRPNIPVITEPFGEYDFAFVDGDHEFTAVLLNLALVARMMPDGGTIIAHDVLSCPEVAAAIETLAMASPEIDYCIIGQSFIQGEKDQHKLSGQLRRTTMKPPRTLSIRKWNHFRIASRRLKKAAGKNNYKHKLEQCDGLGIIKVRDGQKLADLDLDHLLAKKDEMLPQKNKIIRRRALPDDDLSNYLP